MEEKFEVVYEGQIKEFDEKSRALSHAMAMEALNKEVDVYFKVKILSVEMRVKIYQTLNDLSQVYNAFKIFVKREVFLNEKDFDNNK